MSRAGPLDPAGALILPQYDTAVATFRLLGWRTNLLVVIALLMVCMPAWFSTIVRAGSMKDMVMGLGQIGGRARGDMSPNLFLVMWVTMMTAMMLPTIAPIVLTHLALTRRQGRGFYPTIVFTAGYLAVWSLIGVLPLIAYRAFAPLTDDAARSHWLSALAGSILLFAGAYQFSLWKRLCFDRCQSPVAFIASHNFSGGALSALRAGVVHGLFCLGCCWALTSVLLVVGLMNLLWMAGIFVLFFVERSWKHGLAVTQTAGVGLMILGAAVIARPAVLAWISL
jgi:predicted metal-binding membrane protein